MMMILSVINLCSREPSLPSHFLSVASWNVNGLRSMINHDTEMVNMKKLIQQRNIDILCLQLVTLRRSSVLLGVKLMYPKYFGAAPRQGKVIRGLQY